MHRLSLGVAALAVLLAYPAFAQTVPAEAGRVPPVIRFSGRIEAPAGRVPLTFGLYAEQAGGEPLWVGHQVVEVDEIGRYGVVLGAGLALPATLFASGEARWLEVAVEGGVPQPRVMLVSVPYALKAADADTIGGKPLSAFVLAGDRTGVGADGLTYVDTRVLAFGGAGPTPSGGAGTPNYLGMFTDATTLGNSVIYQTPAGAIGVNTLEPAAAFHLKAATAPSAYFDVYSNSLGALPVVYRAARGTPAAPAAVQAHDILGGLAVRGYGTSTFSAGRGQLMFKAAENWTDEAQGTYLQFTTTPLGTGMWAERMRITPDGKVGIGTAAPGQTLSVAGTIESTSGGFRFPDGSVQATAALATVGPTGTFVRSNGTAWVASGIQASDVPQIPASRVTGTAAVLAAENRFSADQSVEGTVTAKAFVGDGSGLTNLAAAPAIAALQAQVAALQRRVDPALWAKGFGGSNSDRTEAVATDASGNIFVTGVFTTTIDLGGGPMTSAGNADIFLAKYTADGLHAWSKQFGGTSSDSAHRIAVDSGGNVIVIGEFWGTVDFGGGALTSAGSSDVFLAKYTAAGAHVWSKRFGGTGQDFGYGVAVDASGNVVVTGLYYATINFGGGALTSSGSADVFVAKFTTAGAYAWSRSCGGTDYDSARTVAVDPAGNVIVGGSFGGVASFGGAPLTSAGQADMFVAKYSSGGSHLWSSRFGSAGSEGVHSVAADPDGNIIVAGAFDTSVDFGGGALSCAGESDAVLAKLTSGGSHVWSKRFGSSGDDSAWGGVAVDSNGNVLLAGWFQGTADFGGGNLMSAVSRDVFLVEFEPNGTYAWSLRLGGTAGTSAFGVTIDASGQVVLGGSFSGTLPVGGYPLVSAGDVDGFVMRIRR